MAYTIAEYKTFTEPGISPIVIDEMRRTSALLDMLPFTDNGVQMAGRWTYGYKRRESKRAAAVRLINTEYTPGTITAPVLYTTDLTIGGGSFTIDRTMAGDGNNQFMAENFEELTQATVELAQDLIFNGDANVAGEFDGLNVALAGSSTEWNVGKVTDLSTSVASNANAREFKRDLGQWAASMSGKADVFVANGAVLPIFSDLVDEWGANVRTSDEFGREFDSYRGTKFLDPGTKPGSSDPIIAIEDREVDGNAETGLTDIYALTFGPQAFHGVSPQDKAKLVAAYNMNPERPGAVHLNEVEVVFTVALEETRAAGVFRNVKVEV